MHRKQLPPWIRVLAPVMFIMGFVVLWWILTASTGIEAWRLPSPEAVGQRALVLLSSTDIWVRIGITAAEAVAGSALGAAVALPLAWVIYKSPLLATAVEPFLGATQALPAIAIAPLLVLWIGYGSWAIAALCALIVFFPILVSTVVGLRYLDPEILEAAELDGARGFTLLQAIEVPLAAPSILSGIRNGFTLSVTGAIVGEMVMGGEGLGQVLVQARSNVDTATMFVVIGILSIMATLAYISIYRYERRVKKLFAPERNSA